MKLCGQRPIVHGPAVTDAQFRTVACATPGVHAVVAHTRHAFPRHTHDQFGIGVVETGAQRSHSGRGQVAAEAGDAIAVNPGEVHDGAPIGGGARGWRMLYFDPRIVAAAAAACFPAAPASFELPKPVMKDRRVASVFRRLFDAETQDPDRPLLREELLLLLVASAGHPGRPDAGGAVPAIEAAKSRIDDDPAGAVRLEELAGLCALDRFSFLRAFARSTGLTPHAYLVQRRIDLARRLISEATPLAQAAAEAGFCDQSHMTRVFVKRFGFTPGAWSRLAARGSRQAAPAPAAAAL